MKRWVWKGLIVAATIALGVVSYRHLVSRADEEHSSIDADEVYLFIG